VDGENGLRCGEPLRVLVAGQWVSGRVEYSQGGALPGYGGWYLCDYAGDGWCPLVPGMLARRPG
jgi:hypothetical protein